MIRKHQVERKMIRNYVFVIMIITLLMAIIPLTSAENGSNDNVPLDDTLTMDQTRAGDLLTHTVFAEDFTAEWCVYCPSASETLKEVYNSGDYGSNFFFVCMITQDADSNVLNQDAQDRANELDISGYPTVEFDGGYYEVTGAQSDDSNYRAAIETCGARVVPDLEIELTAEFIGDAEIDIDVDITNNDGGSYSGTLRVYVVEIVSRYFDYDSNHYPFGFLDYAIDTTIDISSGSTASKTTTWDGAVVTDELGNDFGDIDPDNIIIYATLMNSDNTPYRERDLTHSSKILNLYLIDQAAAVYLSDTPPVLDDDEPPEIEIISPQDFEEITGSIKIEAKITDESSITQVEYRIDDLGVWTPMFNDEFNDYFVFWDSKYSDDGPHTITVRAFDSRNNLGTDFVNIEVKNDFSDPDVEFDNIVDDQELSGIFTLQVKVKDDTGIRSVQFKIDEGSWNNMKFIGSNGYTADFDTNELKDGAHELSVQAEDRAGKIISESIPFYIKNKKTDDTISRTPGFEGVFLLGTVLIFLVYFKLKRK